ncbi:MAG: 16S rRNA (adenine(1518)-N(6)/adenine(1519)-N(6))-dimethyltransferase RsmA [Candidatus Magasanikbacteria bacterium]|nr:16S rRNA (adenine(1518)-N(6)/adenine(1519)-N(6))-dimethyltransferase RsmA [Candidatus Magasanikbacteria bacterium]
MNLLDYTKNYCQENNIKPARSKGQNFLVDESVYDDIVTAAEIGKDEVVMEVGPGLGFLTEKLAEVAKKVVTVELDDKLFGLLDARLREKGQENIEAINMNVLDFNIEEWEYKKNYKIVANLPYNITSVFLRKFLSAKNQPKSLVLMLQKEVAERIAARPGKMSLLAVSVQFYADAEIVLKVGREKFWPSPEVDSAVIKIIAKNKINKTIDEKSFFRLVKFGFSSKRKMLKNNLASGFHLSQDEVMEKIKKAGFGEKVRAQELGVEDWCKLQNEFKL